MAWETEISKVAKLTGVPDTELLRIYVDEAVAEILSCRYPFGYSNVPVETWEEYLASHSTAIVKIAVYLVNKAGAEGQTSHSEGGISRSYESGGIPNNLFVGIVPLVKVVGGESYEATTEEP